MKKKPDSAPMPDEQIIAFLEEILLDQGYMLPRQPEHITIEDLAMYGRGTSRPVEVLRRSFEALMGVSSETEAAIADVSESLSMAARKGSGISDAVWMRMHADREKIEGEDEHDD
jgi:hypothetical protein